MKVEVFVVLQEQCWCNFRKTYFGNVSMANTASDIIDLSNFKLTPDAPCENLHSPLKEFGETLVRNIEELLTDDAPITRSVLISGDWGTGKTSVLNYLKNSLAGGNQSFQIVFFEAWRYENESNLIFALLWQMLKQSSVYKEPSRSKLKQDSLLILGGLFKYTLKISVGELQKGREVINEELLKEATNGIFTEYMDTDKFIKNFAELKNTLYSDEKLLIIIDDLDRCSPSSGIELLDSIRHIIYNTEVTNSMFVVAMDKITLQQAILHKFASISSYDANRYLEKLFPIAFNIPNANVSHTMLKSSENLDDLMTQDDHPIDRIFSQDYFSNARLLKRCLNQAIIFSKSLPDSNQKNKVTVGMMEWIAAINRWPILRKHIQSKGDLFWERVSNKLKNNCVDDVNDHIEDETIKHFLAQPGIKEFLRISHVFGSIYNETTLTQKIITYREYEQELRQVGI